MLHRIVSHLKRLDWLLIGAVVALWVFGLLALWSFAQSRVIGYGVFWKQVGFGAAGLLTAIGLSFLNWRLLQKYGAATLILYAGALGALIGVLFFGDVIRGSRSWYRIGQFSVAPVEFAKVALIALLAKYFSDRHADLYTIRHLCISFFFTAAMTGAVLMEPDAGSAMVLVLLWLGMVLFAGIRRRWVVSLCLLGVFFLALVWRVGLRDYQKERIRVFLNPTSEARSVGYHTLQSQVAIGSGGLTGKGTGEGTQASRLFLPEAATDFIFAFSAEEHGFVGVAGIIACFVVLWYRLLWVGYATRQNFTRLFTFGFTLLTAIHFFINTGMNIGLMPVIGLPLPFVSYGGSHMLALFLGLGVVLAPSSRVYN